jgi:hypothetical protein
MAKQIKLDLHTHPIEGLREQMGIKGIGDIDGEVAAAIVKAVKSAGLNGIAITEHNNFNHGWVTSLEIMDNFRRENLVILPGAEIEYSNQQFLHIYIPEYYRKRIPFFGGKEWFLILAHPGYYNPMEIEQYSQVKFDAVEETSLHGTFSLAQGISQERNIPAIKSSDAHNLGDIGRYYVEVEIR